MITTWLKRECAMWSVYVPSVLETNITSHSHIEQQKISTLTPYLKGENILVL